MMTAIDICAGGLSIGLQRAGFDVLGVEQDADACATHRANVGPCEQADIRTWSPSRSVDLVSGGVPCQDFSQAGRRLGTGGPTGSLYQHLLRIAAEASAKAVLLENVLGLRQRSAEERGGFRPFDQIRLAFEREGWHVRVALLLAADAGRYTLLSWGRWDSLPPCTNPPAPTARPRQIGTSATRLFLLSSGSPLIGGILAPGSRSASARGAALC